MGSEISDRLDRRKRAVQELLRTIPKEDLRREGLQKTPERVAKMYEELFVGYEQNIEEIFKAKFSTNNSSMVIIKDIDYYSQCEHHMVPFFGKVHIGYIPNGHVLGLSKFARLVEAFSRRLQIQEQMTWQIAEAIQVNLTPKGLIVVIEGQHLCMCMRGVKKLNSITTTSAIKGVFETSESTRAEFLTLIK